MKQLLKIIYTIACVAIGMLAGAVYATHSTVCKQAVLTELHNNALYSKQLASQMPAQQTGDFLAEIGK